jgi:hypothetical protein
MARSRSSAALSFSTSTAWAIHLPIAAASYSGAARSGSKECQRPLATAR